MAGPVFIAIAEQVLPYLGVAHDVPPLEATPQRHIAAVDAVEEGTLLVLLLYMLERVAEVVIQP